MWICQLTCQHFVVSSRQLDHDAALYRLGLFLVTRAHKTRERMRGEEVTDKMARGEGAREEGGAHPDPTDHARAQAAAAEAEWLEGNKCLRKASRLGHLEATFSLGALMLGQLVEERVRSGSGGDRGGSGEKTSARQKEGMKFLRQAADGGIAAAQTAMGRILLGGLHGVDRDVVEASSWVEVAAQNGDADSQLLYGCMWIDGFMRKLKKPLIEDGAIKAHAGAVVQERDPEVGMTWVRKAAERGVPEAQFRVGCHLLGVDAGGGADVSQIAQNNQEALGWIRRAADAEHAEAAWLLSRRLSTVATSVATKKAREDQRTWAFSAQREASLWLSRAAHLGVVAAQSEYGRALREGRPGLLVQNTADPLNVTHALLWTRRAAESGDLAAQLELGRLLASGAEGVKRDVVEAVEWLEKAAEAGSNEAKYELGVAFVHGLLSDDILPDPNLVGRGLQLLRKAGEAGLGRATHELGRCMRDGASGVPVNISEARFFLHIAAEEGLAEAQTDYGELLLRGKKGGYKRNEHDRDVWDGLRWLRSAVANGCERAILLLREAEMRVGQPSSSAGWAHSGRSGEVSGGGDFLSHLDASSPLHTQNGRLRITVVRACNLPAPPAPAKYSKMNKRGVRPAQAAKARDPAFVSLEFLDHNATAEDGLHSGAGGARGALAAGEEAAGGGCSDGGGVGAGSNKSRRRDLPRGDDAAFDDDEETWGGDKGYRWMEVARGRTRKGGVTGIDNVWEVPLEDVNAITRVRGWRSDPEWNQTFSVYLEGAKHAWRRPLLFTLFSIRERGGTRPYRAADEVGSCKMPAWTVPLGRRRLMWLTMRRQDGTAVVGSNGKVLGLLRLI